MTTKRIEEQLLRNGEGLAVEFKRCSGSVEHDVFESLGYADQLGSGVRNLFKYAKAYGGSSPRLTEGDIFRIEVSLKNLQVARKRDTEVAPKKDIKIARRLKRVRQKINDQGRADSVENAVAVFTCIVADGEFRIGERG